MSNNIKLTKKVKRKRLNVPRLLVIILFIYILVCAGMYVYKQPINHYEIIGNEHVSDVEILRSTGLYKYPSYLSISRRKIRNKLEANPLIKSAKISYRWNFTIRIEIEENKPLFLVKATNQICLADGSLIDNDNTVVGIPTLLNTTPESVMKLFANNLNEVDDGVLYMINEIEYSPSYSSTNQVIDENRFLLSMTDKNLVYVTAKKTNLLNKYLDIIATSQITGNGTLYLDGNEDRYSFTKFV